MKKIFTLILIQVFYSLGHAQFVEIESYIVRQKIKELAPDCWNGNLLDTTCTSLSTIESININDDAFGPDAEQIEEYFEDEYYAPPFEANLNGLQFLNNLKSINLRISYLYVYSIPDNFPESLTSITASLGEPTYYGSGEGNISLVLSPNVKYVTLMGGYRMYPNSVSCTLSENLEELIMGGDFVSINNKILPNKIKKIVDESSTLTSWHTLPNSLEEFEISYREIDSRFHELDLPIFPSTLKKLTLRGFIYFDENDLEYAPYDYSNIQLVEGLNHLNIEELNINESFIYPQSLKTLSLNYVDFISNIGVLPENLHTLQISNSNPIEKILEDVNIPSSIKNFSITRSQLNEQPILPSQVEILNLSENNISILRELPKTIKELYIGINNIDILENLPPQLEILSVSNNRELKCLPVLPATLKTIDIASTKITCIPNETNTIKATAALPLCPEPCGDIPDLLSGIVFLDLNKNGILDASDRRIQGVFVHADEKILTTNSNGEYRFYANPDAQNNIRVTYNHPHLDKILPAERNHTNSGNNEKIDTMHFAVQLRDVNDIEVIISPFAARNGFTPSVNVTITNRGTFPVNNFNLSLHTPLHWILKSTLPNAQHTADSILWNNISLAVNTSKIFQASLTIPASDTIRTPFALTAKAHQILNDDTPENNIFTLSSNITGSYDPNDKLVYPETLNPGYIEGTELLYTIRFQNTGNDTAFTVVVVDTLQENLDPLSFRYISSTHPCKWDLNEQGIVSFTFENILLPDSNVNEPASNGQVNFAIQPKFGLASGVEVANKAAIYFDYNPPIITNTAITQISVPTHIIYRNEIQLQAYPNPANNNILLNWSGEGKTQVQLIDISGKVIKSFISQSQFEEISVKELSNGMYLIRVENENGSGIVKFIKQ